MSEPTRTSVSTKGVPVRAGDRVRLALSLVLLVVVFVGGGVWLANSVDLASPALATVEQSAPDEVDVPSADGALPKEAEPQAEASEESAEEPHDEPVEPAPVSAEPTVPEDVSEAAPEAAQSDRVAYREERSFVEVEPEGETNPEALPSGQTQTQPQSRSQSQTQPQSQPQQTTQPTQSTTTPTSQKTAPTTPATPQQPEQQTPAATPEPEPAQPQTKTVSITVDGSEAGLSPWSKTMTLTDGQTVYDVLMAADNNVNARSTGYGIYVVGIDGLAEKEHGSTSGWMYAVNGIYPNTACSNYVLKDGDAVTWVYVNVDY